MAVKMILVLCAQVLFIQAAFSQYLDRVATGAWGAGALEGAGLATLGWEASGLAAPGWAGNGWAGNGWAGNGWAGNGCGGNGLAVNGLAGNGWAGNGLAGNGWAGNGLAGNGWAGNGLAGSGWAGAGFGFPGIETTVTSGGALPISSASAIAPVGISIASENAYEGALAVAGELPFVSAIGFEAVLPTAGAGVVNHACGRGVGIVAESVAPAAAYGLAGAYGPAATAYAPTTAAIAPGAGILGYGGRGCGCGGLY